MRSIDFSCFPSAGDGKSQMAVSAGRNWCVNGALAREKREKKANNSSNLDELESGGVIMGK